MRVCHECLFSSCSGHLLNSIRRRKIDAVRKLLWQDEALSYVILNLISCVGVEWSIDVQGDFNAMFYLQ